MNQQLMERRKGLSGNPEKIKAQHGKNKMTARERINYFFDEGTFLELNAYAQHHCTDLGLESNRADGDGVITGFGLVKGQRVFAFAQDFTYLGGSLGEIHAEKISSLLEKALQAGCPVVGLFDSGGARIQEGINSLAGFGKIFRQNTRASGIIPQISAIMGPCAGGSVYSPALTDFVFMVEGIGQMFLTGPQVIVSVTGEKVTAEELGGAETHTTKSGVAHFKARDDKTCLDDIKRLLTFLPASSGQKPQRIFSSGNINRRVDALDTVLPENPGQAYDIHKVIEAIADDGDIMESHAGYAPNLVTCYARIDGAPVGIVANQPRVMAGCLDIAASQKAARFVRTCDAFGLPLITLVDAPGFLPGTRQEYDGIIRHGSALLFAYCEASVPKVTIVLRKAYGGAYIAMCSRELGADAVFAWPAAEIAVMGPDGAANILYKNEIAQSADPAATRAELVRMYRDKFANPFKAAESGYVDDVIEPGETRAKIIQALMMARDKNISPPAKKHGNLPL